MKNKQLKYGLMVLGVLAFLVAGYFILTTTSSAVEGEFDGFARCLTENNAVMYGTDWCSFCSRQKDVFGSSFKEIRFVDCDRNQLECQNAGVTGYPTWVINGQNYPGLKTINQLSEISGCPI